MESLSGLISDPSGTPQIEPSGEDRASVRSETPWQITAAEFDLAEGVLWDPWLARLHWVDLARGMAHGAEFTADRGSLSRTASGHVDATLGALALGDQPGTLLAAGAETLMLLGGEASPTELVRILPAGGPRRLNDAIADPAGRLLVGTAARTGEQRGNALWSWSLSEGLRLLREDVHLSNGLAFSPDGGTLYHVDSRRHRVDRADYDVSSGEAGNWRTVLQVEGGHQPDGLTVDAEGRLWLAVWGAGQLRRYSPDGALLEVVAIPAPKVSCPGFAGDDLRTLVISTARAGLGPEELARWPNSGALFALRTDVPGLPEHRVRLGARDREPR